MTRVSNTANAEKLIRIDAPAKRCAVGALLRFWALRRPQQLCCALDDHLFTFAEIDSRADQLAAGLAALGIGKGDRVATLAPNRVETLELFYARARGGAVQVRLNAYLKRAGHDQSSVQATTPRSTPSRLLRSVSFTNPFTTVCR